MQLEIGKIVEGTVTGITKFGAFVDLGEGKTGMVHISEGRAYLRQGDYRLSDPGTDRQGAYPFDRS